ncbi:hypothetical protein F0562_028444 [Nyssa sinensis]|uniref:Serine/threonine protein phosphatase 2A regulatory subunit n=1 Tax=Nyssa sinensis TaxID=561372 RepID=A0A5J5B180_9ASTE|nr:hypothetical protein F0562_028444 [Nyssa sinensis]
MGVQRNSPKTSPKKKATTLEDLFNLESRTKTSSNLSGKSFRTHLSVESEHEEVLSLISYCTFTYTFTDPSESPSQQDQKRFKLAYLLSILKSAKTPPHEEILPPLFSMISANLFRPLSPSSTSSSVICFLPDDEEVTATPVAAWPHLQIVYDILLRLIINSDATTLQDYIDHSFLLNLLSLFQSEDPRERESLKNVFHLIYSKFTLHRSFMRKAMNDVFLHYIFEMDRHGGIGELLEIWGSIINGFAVPLKQEHRVFLMRVLVPLHKPKGMQVYHRQLAYCVSQFVQKEPVLGGVVVRGILKYWPVTNCQKEVFLIGELEEIVENIDPEQYRKLALPLCTQITKCLNSWNSQVAERALYVWNNEMFVRMASHAMEEVFPVIVEGMEKNLNWHWSSSVRQLTENVKEMLEEMEPYLYSKCLEQLENEKSAAHQEEMKRKKKWERIEMAAAKNLFLQQPHVICVSN